VDAALGWIGAIIEWLGKFIPRQVIVDSTRGALKWVNPLRFPWRDAEQTQQRIVVLSSGRHWYWPWTTKFEDWPVARTTRPLPTQDITTTDDRVVTVTGMLTFEVADLELLLAHTEDPNDAIRDIAGMAVHEVLAEASYEHVMRGNLGRRLKGAAERALRPYGVRVLELTFHSRTPATVVRVVNSTPTDGL